MNLQKMREDNMEKKFNDFIPTLKSRELIYNDQDVLNATCYDKIKFISPEYNVLEFVMFIRDAGQIYDAQEWKKACSDPTIVHHASPSKPWKKGGEHNCRCYNEWDKYRKIAEKKIYGTPVIANGTYTISSALDKNKALDIAGASYDDKANLQIWDKNYTNAQKFKITYIAEGYYQIEACCSGKALDVAGAENRCGANVWQYQKNDSDAQKWLIKRAGNGYFYIISKCNGLYLDVSGAETKKGTNIHVWNFNGTDAQKFKISQ